MISFDENTKVKKQSFMNLLQRLHPLKLYFLFVGHTADLPCDK